MIIKYLKIREMDTKIPNSPQKPCNKLNINLLQGFKEKNGTKTAQALIVLKHCLTYSYIVIKTWVKI